MISILCLTAAAINGFMYFRTKDSFRYVWLFFGLTDAILVALTVGVL